MGKRMNNVLKRFFAVWRRAGAAIFLLMVAGGGTVVRADANVTVGPETVVPIPVNPVYYYANDSCFPYIRNSNGTTHLTFWVDGANFRSEGPSLDAMNPIDSTNAVLGATAGAFDNGGVWLQRAVRVNGVLYGFYHAEDHSCVPYTEWNSTGLATSTNDGASWTKEGEILGSPNPCTGFGGVVANTVVWDAANSRWMGWGGPEVFVSTNAAAAPGTWYAYTNGSFSVPQPGPGPTGSLPTLNANLSVQSVAWNPYFNAWFMTYNHWGDGLHIFYTTSRDGITWAPEMTLTTGTTNYSVGYPEIIGDTDLSFGQDGWLVYERFPSTQPDRSRDMMERWVHFGALTAPASPTNLSASGQWACQPQVTLTWNATAQAQGYNLFRAGSSGGIYTQVGSVSTSASFPTYVDNTVTAGNVYYYEVQTTNTAGASALSAPVRVYATGAVMGNAISVNFAGGTTGVTNTLMDCSEVAGVVPVAGWNNAVGATGTVANVIYNGGAAAGATVSWSSANTWSSGITDQPGNYRMMEGYLDGANPSVTISNLPAAFTNAGYNVYVYANGDSTSGRTGKYTIGATSLELTDSSRFSGNFGVASNGTGNYVLFTNLSAAGFTLVCQGVGGGDGNLRAPVNGLQVVATRANLGGSLTGQVVGGSIQITWPGAELGWDLEVQTNSLTPGHWVEVPDSFQTTQTTFPLNASESVFFRLRAN